MASTIGSHTGASRLNDNFSPECIVWQVKEVISIIDYPPSPCYLDSFSLDCPLLRLPRGPTRLCQRSRGCHGLRGRDRWHAVRCVNNSLLRPCACHKYNFPSLEIGENPWLKLAHTIHMKSEWNSAAHGYRHARGSSRCCCRPSRGSDGSFLTVGEL